MATAAIWTEPHAPQCRLFIAQFVNNSRIILAKQTPQFSCIANHTAGRLPFQTFPPPPAILGSTPCPLPPGKPFSPGNHFSGELRGDLPCSWPAGDEGQAGTGLQHGQGLLCLGSNATTYGTPQRMGSLKYPSSSSVFGSRAVPGLSGHCCCLLQTSLPGPSGQTGLFFYYTRSLF